MKKMILMALLAMAVTSVKAQYEPGRWSLKPYAALGFSTLSNMEALPLFPGVKLDKKIAAAARSGLVVEYQVAERVGIEAGLMYGMQGCGWDDYKAGDNKLEDFGLELQYIQVPVAANIYLVKGLALKAGVQVGFLTSADVKYTTETKINGYDTTSDTRIDFKKECNTVDVSIPVGLSYEFDSHWVIDATYSIGLTKVNKDSDPDGNDHKNGVFFVGFGYKFGL